MRTTSTRLTALLLGLVLGLAACGESDGNSPVPGAAEGMTGDAAAGETVFADTCTVCHGPDAGGLEGLGKGLHSNEFVDGKTDDELVAFMKVGRSADDPLNTTGVAMLPKGGNDALTDQDLYDVVAYLRALD